MKTTEAQQMINEVLELESLPLEEQLEICEARRRKPSRKQAEIDAILAKRGTVRLPSVDMSKYTPIKGMEGPFRFRDGRILYYDPREGRYYDRRKDMYLARDDIPEEFEAESNLEEADEVPISEIIGPKNKIIDTMKRHGYHPFTAFSGIIGDIVLFKAPGSGVGRLDASTMKKIIGNKHFRWIEFTNNGEVTIGM